MTTAVPQGIWDDAAGHDVAHTRIATRVIASFLVVPQYISFASVLPRSGVPGMSCDTHVTARPGDGQAAEHAR